MENEVVSKLELKVLGGKGPDKTKYIVNVANQFLVIGRYCYLAWKRQRHY